LALALKEAKTALKLAPSLAPAAALVARLYAARGRKRRALRIVETTFAREPHPGLVEAYLSLLEGDTPETRAQGLHRLAALRPETREGARTRARAEILSGHDEDAAAILDPVVAESASAADYALMAEALSRRYPDRAELLLRKAASAPLKTEPGADGAFQFTREGWARLVREYMEHGRLAPPPLEDGTRLSESELQLLTARPEPAPATEAPLEPFAAPAPEPSPEVADETARIAAAAGKVS
jgi:HemY protein